MSAKVWRVNNTTGVQADFTTITAAVSVAAAGDTIYVEGSTTQYSGTTISKKLTLIGPGYYLADPTNTKTEWNQNMAKVGQFTFGPGSSGSVCAGLYMNSYQYLNDQNITIERCFVSEIVFGHGADINCDHDTIRQCVVNSVFTCQPTGGTFSAQGELVYNNLINGAMDFSSNMAGTSIFFINNVFVANGVGFKGQNCVFQNNIFNYSYFGAYGSSNFFTNNIISNSSVSSSIAEGNNNQFGVAWNEIFRATSPNINNAPTGYSHDGQYQLAAGSAAIGAGVIGSTTVDCGAFGGAAPYILSGMPDIPSIYSLTVPAQVNNGTATINISLSSAAH